MIRHFSPYDSVALEYYNAALHPTCANFRSLGRKFLLELFEERDFMMTMAIEPILETGCGMSMLAETAETGLIDFPKQLILQDDSEEMIRHSQGWRNSLADFFVSDARQMPAHVSMLAGVFSFLADPYNDQGLWNEIQRVLAPRGFWVLTVPSHAWATQFRRHSSATASRFVTVDGSEYDLPSFTYPPHVIIAKMAARGFSLLRFQNYTTDQLTGHVSKKLRVSESDNSVLDCFVFRKKGRSAGSHQN
jgi:SAM-dependent methyltransferase